MYAMPLCAACGVGVDLGKHYCDTCRIEKRRESWRVAKWKKSGRSYGVVDTTRVLSAVDSVERES